VCDACVGDISTQQLLMIHIHENCINIAYHVSETTSTTKNCEVFKLYIELVFVKFEVRNCYSALEDNFFDWFAFRLIITLI
jgi:hypothetical protein